MNSYLGVEKLGSVKFLQPKICKDLPYMNVTATK